MSFRGFGGPDSGGAARERGQQARQSSADRHGEELRETIRNLLDDSQDAEIQEALLKCHQAVQRDQWPSIGVIVNQVAQLVDLTGSNMSPRDAILRMAEAKLDYQVAAGGYLEQPGGGNSPLLSSPSESERNGDADKVERQEEGDHCINEDTEEDLEGSPGEDKAATGFHRNLAANPGIDRSVAKRGYPDQSKLTITVRRPDGRPDKVHRYPGEVDFREPVQSLNRWRSQIFRRHFGASRPYRQRFHELEKDWLLNEHIDFEQRRLAEGKLVDYRAMRWDEIAKRFNRRFEGQYLPDVTTPRPYRTRVALRVERSRVKKITNHTGLRFRMQPRPGESKRGPKNPEKNVEAEDEKEVSEEEEDGGKNDEDNDDNEERQEGQAPGGTRRGDLPPRKKPWRKDGSDEDPGGEGLSQPIQSN